MSKKNPKSIHCFIFGEPKTTTNEEIVFDNELNLPKYIIIDCSMLSYIDTSGVTTLKNLVQNHLDISVEVLLTGCAVHIETMLKKDGFFKEVSSDRVFKSVHDAVTMIRGTTSKIGFPIVPRNRSDLSGIISKISLDRNSGFESHQIFDSHKSILSKSTTTSPQLKRMKPIRSGSFSDL